MTSDITVIETKRFGKLEIPQDKIISFASGLVGMPEVQHATIIDFKYPFVWLQSIAQPETAFLAVTANNLALAKELPHYLESLETLIGLKRAEDYLQLFIVSVSGHLSQATVNLKAPIYLNPANMQAVQEVVDAKKFNIRTSLWSLVAKPS